MATPQQAKRTRLKQKAHRKNKEAGGVEIAPANGRLTQEEMWAYGLGLFGIGLGLAELMAPQRRSSMLPGRDSTDSI